MTRRYVVVGNGIAGMEAALALRARDADSPISLVSVEHDHLFSRPALMYVFSGQLDVRATEPFDRGLYERMGFERVRGRVTALRTDSRELELADGRRLPYDRLLLACGSRARPATWPGADGPGVHGFVTLRDLEALDREARPGQRAAVVGGGLIGVEVAEILRHRGLEVSFVIRESWYFPVALEPRESRLVAEHMRGHGVDVRLGVEAEQVLRDEGGQVVGVRVRRSDPAEDGPDPGADVAGAGSGADAGGTVPADLVVVSIGVVPDTGFLEGSGIDRSDTGAIEVDDALRTSVEGVWAAGDCANVTWIDGSRRPEQLWYTARDQGRVAAASMLGDEAGYRRTTWYNSAKFFDLEYTTAGWVPASVDRDGRPARSGPDLRTWFHRVPGRPETQRIVCRGERVVGFNMLGSRWNHERLLEWIDQRRELDWVVARLSEAQFDEEFERRFAVHPDAVEVS